MGRFYSIPKTVGIYDGGAVTGGAPRRGSVRGNGWPLVGSLAGCLPQDKARYAEHDRKHGVPTDYAPDGSPIWRSLSHQRRWFKLHGFYNKDDNA